MNTEQIKNELSLEINRLQQARNVLAGIDPILPKRRGRPSKMLLALLHAGAAEEPQSAPSRAMRKKTSRACKESSREGRARCPLRREEGSTQALRNKVDSGSACSGEEEVHPESSSRSRRPAQDPRQESRRRQVRASRAPRNRPRSLLTSSLASRQQNSATCRCLQC